MKPFYNMLKIVTSSYYHDQIQRFVAPLNDLLGINHFWYYKITSSGHYVYLGSHSSWNEYCFDKSMISNFSCLRHPSLIPSGINLMQACPVGKYKQVLDAAWDKFQINFNINLTKKIPEGIEAFGFASRFNDPYAEQRLLNELPLLHHFTKMFRTKFSKLFRMIDEHPIDLPSQFGSVFYENSREPVIPIKRDQFLRKIGLESILTLTPREIDVAKWIANGYPASYIAQQLQLNKRTVENYIVAIKDKLSCSSKVELIQKAQEIVAFNIPEMY